MNRNFFYKYFFFYSVESHCAGVPFCVCAFRVCALCVCACRPNPQYLPEEENTYHWFDGEGLLFALLSRISTVINLDAPCPLP